MGKKSPMFAPLRASNGAQWQAFIAAFLGWTLDAFDFFLVTFVLARIAGDFRRAIPGAARPIGERLTLWTSFLRQLGSTSTRSS